MNFNFVAQNRGPITFKYSCEDIVVNVYTWLIIFVDARTPILNTTEV